VGVNPQFDDFVCGAGFRWIRGCHGFLRSRILVPLNNLMSSSRKTETYEPRGGRSSVWLALSVQHEFVFVG
jgi:hypothetical protein